MNLAELKEKGKDLLGRIPKDVCIFFVFILGCSLSFGLGIWVSPSTSSGQAGQGSSFSMKDMPEVAAATNAVATSTPTGGQIVASKNGSKYYFPSCSGVSRITPANKIWFKSVADARAQGYTPAANCPGI